MPETPGASPAETPTRGDVLPATGRSQVTARTVVVVLMTALAVLGGLYLLYALQQIVRWLLIAVFLAVALTPPVNWLHQRRVPRGLAIGMVYLALLVLAAGLGALVLPPLIAQGRDLVSSLVETIRQPGGLTGAVDDLARQYGLAGVLTSLRAQASALPSRLSLAAGPLLQVTRGIVGSVTALISIVLISFFLLLDGRSFVNAGVSLVAPTHQPRLRRLLMQAAQAVYGYISGNLTISLIAGVSAFIAMAILHVHYAVALALVVALLDLIPLVGATLGAVIVVLVGWFVSPLTAGLLAAYFALYQQVENNVLQPLVYGRSVRLHPLAIFLAVLVGAELLGILGALIAIPSAEILRLVGAEWLAGRRDPAQARAAPGEHQDSASAPSPRRSGS